MSSYPLCTIYYLQLLNIYSASPCAVLWHNGEAAVMSRIIIISWRDMAPLLRHHQLCQYLYHHHPTARHFALTLHTQSTPFWAAFHWLLLMIHDKSTWCSHRVLDIQRFGVQICVHRWQWVCPAPWSVSVWWWWRNCLGGELKQFDWYLAMDNFVLLITSGPGARWASDHHTGHPHFQAWDHLKSSHTSPINKCLTYRCKSCIRV